MPTARHWTDAERETLAMLFPHHKASYIAKVLGRTEGSVFANASRLGIEKANRGEPTKTDKILQACKMAPKGLTLHALAQFVNENTDFCNTIAGHLVRDGRLFRAGERRRYHYFADAQTAAAFADELAAEGARLKAEAKAKKQRDRNAARRKQWAEAKANKPKPAPKPKPEKTPVYAIKPSKPKPAPMPTKVIYPDNYKLTVIPTPPSRFAPPEGWIGSFKQEWIERTSSQTGRNV